MVVLNLTKNKVDFQFLLKDNYLFSNLCELKINKKKLSTPSLWLGHIIDLNPKPWEFIELENLMINAYYIINKPSSYQKICEKGIHNYLNFDGLIMMDSGGFLFQKKEEIDLNPLELLDLYEKSKPDIGVILDHPLDPKNTNQSNKKRWQETLKNTKIMMECNSKVPLMPVIHGYSFSELKKACSDIKKIDDDPKLIGLGSLVPLVLNSSAASKRFGNCMQFILESMKLIRNEFPNAMLHAFGVGSARTMHLMYSIGADSLDSTGWRIKAAYGVIQLPGLGDRYPKTRNNGRRVINAEEKKILAQCKCPTCNEKSISQRINILNEKFPERALHNAWVFKKEEEHYKRAVIEDNTREFLEKRLKIGHYSKSFNFLINSKETKPLTGWI